MKYLLTAVMDFPLGKSSVYSQVELKSLLYRKEAGELAVQQLLQLALVELQFVSIVSRVVVENCYQSIHCTLELARHSAGRRETRSF